MIGSGDVASSPGGRAPVARRIRGVDLARAVAIVGMVMVHIGPTQAGGVAGELYALPHGRASMLFVLLAGMGVSLLDRGRAAGLTAARLTVRTVVLLPVGLALQELDHGVAVILQNYALLFVVALALRPLGSRWLMALAGVWFVAGPGAHVALEHANPGVFFGDVTALTDPPREILRGLLATGTYPLLTWVAPFALGMWVGRHDLSSPTVLVRLFTAGAVVAVVVLWVGVVAHEAAGSGGTGWWALATDPEPHSQSLVWLISSSSAAVVFLAVCLAAAALAPRAVTPLVALGQLALSFYVGHLLVIAAFEDVVRVDDVAGAALRVLVMTAVAAVLALAWRARYRRGPLEMVLHAPVAMRQRRQRRAAGGGAGAGSSSGSMPSG